MHFEDDRPYWERHYGIIRGRTSREAWKRLGRAWLIAVGVVCVVAVLGTVIGERL